MIARNLTVLNILLIGICLVYGTFTLPGWFSEPQPVSVSVPAEDQEQTGATTLPTPMEPIPYPPLADFTAVSDKNLFTPERTYVKPEVVVEAGPPPQQPAFMLYGVVEAGSKSVAMMEDQKAPVATPGRGKRLVSVRIGEVLSSYTLETVAQDSVVMVLGENRITVPLVDSSKPKYRVPPAPPVASRATPTPPQRTTKKNLADAFRIPKEQRPQHGR